MLIATNELLAVAPGADDVMIDDFQAISQHPYANLCWAACAAMVMTHLGKPMSLQDVVFAVLGRLVDQAEWPETAYSCLGVGCLYLENSQVNDSGLRQWIGAGYPLQPYIQWFAGGDHVLIISGVFADGRLRLYDPLNGESSTNTLEDLKTAYREGALAGLWYDMAVNV